MIILCFVVESKVLAQLLETGQRLPKQDACAEDVHQLMLSCWDFVPQKRPV